jgi:polyphosphate kinase
MFEPPHELAELLETAQAPQHPLPIRLRALSLVAQMIDQAFTNPDRTFAQQISFHYSSNHPDKLPSTPLLAFAASDVAAIFVQINQIFREQIIPLLEQQQIYITPLEYLSDEQRNWLHNYFAHRIYPLLTPLAVDPGHPFPYISSDSLNYLILLQASATPDDGSGRLFARVKVPRRAVPRIVFIPAIPQAVNNPPVRCYLAWSEDIVRYFAAQLFPGMLVKGIYQFHILRAAYANDPNIHPETVRAQKSAAVVRLDIEEKIPGWILRWLLEHLAVPADVVVRCTAPLSITNLADLADAITALLTNT